MEAQKNRPAMLNRLSSPAKPAPIVAVRAFCSTDRDASVPVRPRSFPPKTSWSIGEAMPMMPIPALTLRHRTAHSSQNWGILWTASMWTWPWVIMPSFFLAGGVQPAGVQPAGGMR